MVPVQAQWLLCDGTGLFDSYQIISFLTRVSQGVCFPLSIFIDIHPPPPPSSLPLPISTFSLLSSIFLSSLLPYITPSRAATRPEYRCRCQMDRWESPWFLAKIQTPAFPLFSYTWAATEIHTIKNRDWQAATDVAHVKLSANTWMQISFVNHPFVAHTHTEQLCQRQGQNTSHPQHSLTWREREAGSHPASLKITNL